MTTQNPSQEPAPPDQDAAAAPPASPPLPTRHTAVTPGPRASRLQEAYGLAISRTLARVSWDNFASCYPTVAARNPAALRTVQGAMVRRLGELCEKEFDLIMSRRGVVPKLNELESLFSDAARRRDEAQDGESPPIPPHLLPAETIAAAHLHPHLVSQQSQLNAKLQTTQSLNTRLFDEINAQRAEVAELLAELERALADVEGASGLLDSVVDDLGRETREVEAEMMES